MIAVETMMVSYKQFGFVSSALPAHKNAISDVRGPERREQFMLLASHTGQRTAARRFCLEQKADSLLRERKSRFSQAGDLVMDLFCKHLLRSSGVLQSLRHRLFVRPEQDPECFSLARKVFLRQFLKADLSAGTDMSNSREGVEAAEVMARVVPKVATADWLLIFAGSTTPVSLPSYRRAGWSRLALAGREVCWYAFNASGTLLGRIVVQPDE